VDKRIQSTPHPFWRADGIRFLFNSMTTHSEWLPTPEAARALGISPDTLKRRRDHVGGYLSQGRHWRLKTESANSAILWRVDLIRAELDKRGAVNARNAQLERAADKVIADTQKSEVQA